MDVLLEFVIQDLWWAATKATHERFGWLAATAIAASPILILVLIVWLIVILVS